MSGLDRLDQELRRQEVNDSRVVQLTHDMARVCDDEGRSVTPAMLIAVARATVGASTVTARAKGFKDPDLIQGVLARRPRSVGQWYGQRRRWALWRGVGVAAGLLSAAGVMAAWSGPWVWLLLVAGLVSMGVASLGQVRLQGLRSHQPTDQQIETWNRHAPLKRYLDQVAEHPLPLLTMDARYLDRKARFLNEWEAAREVFSPPAKRVSTAPSVGEVLCERLKNDPWPASVSSPHERVSTAWDVYVREQALARGRHIQSQPSAAHVRAASVVLRHHGHALRIAAPLWPFDHS